MAQVASVIFPVICAWLAGLPRFPAPSTVLPPRSPVLSQTHVAPSHGPPARVFSPLSFPVSLLHSSKLLRESSALLLHLVFQLPKLCGKGSPKSMLFQPSSMAAMPGFKSQSQSSSGAPFLTPPTVSYTCQHYLFFHPFLAAIVSLGRRGPMAWSQSYPSSHTGPVTRGSCLPVTSWVEVTPILLAPKHSHSYLTYL